MDIPQIMKNLTFQVIVAIIIGIALGNFYPDLGMKMEPFSKAFIKMIKMVITPVVFLTVVIGISSIGDIKKVGKLGVKAIIYFEVVTTIAMILGMVFMNVFKPGQGFPTGAADEVDVSSYVNKAKIAEQHTTADFLLGVIPDNAVQAFASGDLLQVLFIAILFGISLSAMGEKGKPVEEFLERISKIFFGIINMIMKFAPLGAFGAIAFVIGKFGLSSLQSLLMLVLYALEASVAFILCILVPIGMYYKVSIFSLIKYIKDEIFIVIGTGSSEPVLPKLMEKLTKLGCSKPVVGLVVPTGYSFNLDGTSLYLSMCVLFIAQAYNIDLSLVDQASILGVMLLTSKGAAGVAGSGFVVLAATIAATKVLPIQGIAILLGVDRIMSSVRATVNLIGNAFATMVIARMENQLDDKMTEAEYSRVEEEKSHNG